MNYSKKILKRFSNPKNVGRMKNPDGIGDVGNMVCGDRMVVYIKVKKEKIKDISFLTYGCVSAIASSDIVCDLVKGKTLKEAEKLTYDRVVKALGGMPPIKLHCSVLGISALKKAIEDYRNKQKVK